MRAPCTDDDECVVLVTAGGGGALPLKGEDTYADGDVWNGRCRGCIIHIHCDYSISIFLYVCMSSIKFVFVAA